MAIRPTMTGRAPLSPLRTRLSQTRVYSPSDWASTSGALVSAISAATSSPAPGSPASATDPAWSLGASPCSVPAILQPSEPLLARGEVARSPPLPSSPSRVDVPVVMRSTADCRSNSAAGAAATSLPR